MLHVPKLQGSTLHLEASLTCASQETLVGAAWVIVAEPAYLEVVGMAAAGFALA